MRRLMVVLLSIALLACGQSREFTNKKNRAMLETMARRLEVKERAQAPAWASRKEAPVLTVAWLSDTHLGVSKGAVERTRVLLNQLRDELHPDMTLVTGDNNAQAEGLAPKHAGLPKSHQWQLWFKEFLDRELARPYAVIPGDNWPWDFEKVFGSPTRSFTMSGYHFVLLATDAKAQGNDACAVVYADTKAWVEADLASHASQPCFVVMHETVLPPLFLDADWLSGVVSSRPQALALLSGHLHFDLDLQWQGCRNIVAPAVGPSQRPAFKMMRFYRDQVVLHTYEWDGERFAPVQKWQRVKVPKRLRQAIPREVTGGAKLEEMRSMPVRAKVRDQGLLQRAAEIDQRLMSFFMQFGTSQMLP